MPKTRTNPGRDLNLGERIRTDTQTANYTVLEGESGTHFTNRGATGAVTFTLPALRDGLWYVFMNAVLAQNLIISATAGELVYFNDIAGNSVAFQTASERAGGAVYVWCDGAKWNIHPMIHTLQTMTFGT